MDHFTRIIIGGGPAGLMAAYSGGGPDTLLIESGPKAGRKLLITAAGQCNFTHRGTVPELLSCYNEKERFLRPALYAFSNDDVIRFFDERGVPSFFDEKDRCLPRSLSARDVLHALQEAGRLKGTRSHNNDRVREVEKIDRGFRVITKLRQFTCEKLIIATGGKSFPKTGSLGDGYSFAKELGHRIVPLQPALTGIESDNFPLTPLAGLSFEDIKIELYRNNKRVHPFKGNLLITHKGISGPVIINNSREMREGDEILLNFISLSREELDSLWKETVRREGKKGIGAFLKQQNLPRKLIPSLLGDIPAEKGLAQITQKERSRLFKELTAYPFKLERLQGWNTAMVTAGGVETKEINGKTMESRLVENLFFAGEVIDIDGNSGGYNLQAAFSTGYLAGLQ
jgi:predicted Rossmann fold flavoprotein